MNTKKFNAKQIRWIEKLIAFDFTIEYRKNIFNFANASSKKFDMIKFDDNENNNNDFFLFCETNFAIENFNSIYKNAMMYLL